MPRVTEVPYPPRIRPVPIGGGDAETQELLAPLGEKASSNFFRTIVWNPRIFKRWVPYSLALLRGSLPDRDREILTLRAAHRGDGAYVWQSHLAIARDSGLDDEEIERVRQGAGAAGWGPFDTTLLRAADEIVDEHRLSDGTWETLAGRYDERQLIEVPMVVGVYFSLGFTLNSFGVELEPEVR